MILMHEVRREDRTTGRFARSTRQIRVRHEGVQDGGVETSLGPYAVAGQRHGPSHQRSPPGGRVQSNTPSPPVGLVHRGQCRAAAGVRAIGTDTARAHDGIMGGC